MAPGSPLTKWDFKTGEHYVAARTAALAAWKSLGKIQSFQGSNCFGSGLFYQQKRQSTLRSLDTKEKWVARALGYSGLFLPRLNSQMSY